MNVKSAGAAGGGEAENNKQIDLYTDPRSGTTDMP